jgi:hypothetical protein
MIAALRFYRLSRPLSVLVATSPLINVQTAIDDASIDRRVARPQPLCYVPKAGSLLRPPLHFGE